MSSDKIDSILQEERQFAPSPSFAVKARIKSIEELQALRRRATEDHAGFWGELARQEIAWHKPFQSILDSSGAPQYRWFHDGLLNVSANCLDRQLAAKGDKTAIIFEGEQGDIRTLSYAQLHREVCRFANALKAQGIVKGDRVVIYMPMIPEAVIAMQACARIGALHSVVFGGF